MTKPLKQRSFEVIRTHEATGRVQLVTWNLHEEQARFVADGCNVVAANKGYVVPSSGVEESGWTHSVRRAGCTL